MLFLATAMGPVSAGVPHLDDPLRFFAGRTESVSTIKVIARKPYRSNTVGHGEIGADGALDLVQRVEEDGRPAFERRWRIRKIAPARFSGTMSEAKGSVTIDEIGGRFRFRFTTKSNFSVEQWLTPAADGRSARSVLMVRRLGLKVASSEGIVRRVE